MPHKYLPHGFLHTGRDEQALTSPRKTAHTRHAQAHGWMESICDIFLSARSFLGTNKIACNWRERMFAKSVRLALSPLHHRFRSQITFGARLFSGSDYFRGQITFGVRFFSGLSYTRSRITFGARLPSGPDCVQGQIIFGVRIHSGSDAFRG